MKWHLESIDTHLPEIKRLFEKTAGHKHADNYSKWPLFEHTKFARMAYDPHMIYHKLHFELLQSYGKLHLRNSRYLILRLRHLWLQSLTTHCGNKQHPYLICIQY